MVAWTLFTAETRDARWQRETPLPEPQCNLAAGMSISLSWRE
jgi:hypothetical protein